MKSKRQFLGQHLLSSELVAEQLIAAADLQKKDIVLEIGTGSGFLTRRMSPHVRKVITYEVDESVIDGPDARDLKSLQNVVQVITDPMELSSVDRFDVCVSSLPYSRSRDFVEWISRCPFKFRKSAIIVQDEFAKKLAAKAGEENYRAISAIAQISFDIELKNKVERNAFRPPPKVTSRIVKLVPRTSPEFPFFNDSRIAKLHQIFSQRRRLVERVIPAYSESLRLKFVGRRIHSLSPEELATLL